MSFRLCLSMPILNYTRHSVRLGKQLKQQLSQKKAHISELIRALTCNKIFNKLGYQLSTFTKFTTLEVSDCLHDLLLTVHDKRTVLHNRLT